MARLKILSKIDNLQDNNCVGCKLSGSFGYSAYCRNECEVGLRIKGLGDKLLSFGSETKKIKEILGKGKNMTTNDIVHLKNKRISNKKIAKTMGIGVNRLAKIIKNIQGRKNDA